MVLLVLLSCIALMSSVCVIILSCVITYELYWNSYCVQCVMCQYLIYSTSIAVYCSCELNCVIICHVLLHMIYVRIYIVFNVIYQF